MRSGAGSAAHMVKAALLALALSSPVSFPATLARMARYPKARARAPACCVALTSNEDVVVFIYGGDLWSVPVRGGLARRLTGRCATPDLAAIQRIQPGLARLRRIPVLSR